MKQIKFRDLELETRFKLAPDSQFWFYKVDSHSARIGELYHIWSFDPNRYVYVEDKS